ncbi:MAG TPA: glycosyltransferase [Pseudomonadales bacterium]|nr:glycosyltransferase [Pseudomonadales bacterium]
MKILISADACTPFSGSEAHFGWSVVQCMARRHDLWVITSGRHQADLERAAAQGMVPPSVTFAYANFPKPRHSNFIVSRFQNWMEYSNFTREAFVVGKKLHESVQFDLVHHVTVSTWRMGLPFWKLGIPFIWGPIGGAEQFPLKLYSLLSAPSKAYELTRTLSNGLSRCSPSVRACARHATHIATANNETKRLVAKLRGTESGVSLLSPAFFPSSTIGEFSALAPERRFDDPLRFFAGGMLEGRKGVALAIEALARLKQQGMKLSFHIGGHGAELGHLRNLADRLGLGTDVVFGLWKGTDYLNQLATSHVYLLPSLRESAGLTMMEAMLTGCVPVIADCGGPGHIVTEACGSKIPVGNAAAMIDSLTAAIAALDTDRALLQRKSIEATNRITTSFSEEAYFQAMNNIYQQVTHHQNDPAGQNVQTA